MKLNLTWIAAGLAVMTAFGCKPPPPPEQKVPVAATVKSFTVDKPQIAEAGDTVTLSWEVENATGVSLATLDGTAVPLTDATAATGSVETKVEANTVFVLTAHGEGGGDSAAVSVVLPTSPSDPLLAALPETIEAGQKTTLVWNVAGATEVSLTDSAGQSVYSGDQAAGSIAVMPNSTTTYTLTAGEATVSAKVAVTPAVVAFTSSDPAAHPGDKVTLSWKVGGAESLTLSADGRGDLTTVTDAAQLADGSFEDTVPADLPANGLVHYTLTAKQGDAQVIRELTLWVGSDPIFTSFAVPSYAKVGGTYQVQWSTVLADHLEISVDGKVVHVATTPAEVQYGTLALPTPTQDATVELRATNARGGVATQTTTVSPVDVPTLVSFTATPNPAAHGGDAVRLDWNVTNARHVKISVKGRFQVTEITGSGAETSFVDVYPNGPTVYVLEADNQVGDAIPPQELTATVTTPADLVYSQSDIPEGARVQVTGHTVPGGTDIEGLPALNQPGEGFVDIADPANDINYSGYDTTADLVPLGETFQTTIFGVPVSADQITVSINGWFALGDSHGDWGEDGPTSKDPAVDLRENCFAPLFADLYTGSGTTVYRRLDTVNGDRRLIVQWDDAVLDGQSSSSLTFQAQIYASGKIVYAYQTMSANNLDATIGALNAGKAFAPHFDHTPLAGETLTLSGVTLPATVVASSTPMHVRVKIPPSGYIEIDSTPKIFPFNLVGITEVMYNPTLADGEWFEVTNFSSNPVDLNGWTIDFGGGQTATISGTAALAAGGRMVMGQTATSAESGTTGGSPVDFVYGTALTMPNSSGQVGLVYMGVPYTKAAWTTAGTTGVSLRNDDRTYFAFSSSTVKTATCPSTEPFGVNGQLGTPGAVNPRCFGWDMAPIPGNFQSIKTTGNPIAGMQTTGNNSIDSVVVPLDFTASGGHAVKIGGTLYGNATNKLYVSSNGWVSLVSTTSSNGSNGSNPSTGAPNGTLAVFWDDLAANATQSGVYWQQFDPDSTPASGDEYTLISWENWKTWSSSTTSELNFQIRIDEATGAVEYHYGTMTSSDPNYSNGDRATVWLESLDGRTAAKVLANQSLLKPNSGWRFTYTP